MEITIKINPEKKEAKTLIEYLRCLSFVTFENDDEIVEEQNMIELMKDSKNSGYISEEEKNELLKNI